MGRQMIHTSTWFVSPATTDSLADYVSEKQEEVSPTITTGSGGIENPQRSVMDR